MLENTAAGLRLFLAFFLFAVTGLQGLTLCLCAPDPDACGEHHSCGCTPEPQSEHVDHACDHLTVADLPPCESGARGPGDLLAALVVLAMANAPHAVIAEDIVTYQERPPDVLQPHLYFLARSTQILC
ncbi:MAG TPA: hypothetical protein PKM57_06605 [Kiritimatiellia bacterium]|nr:hypothetical protein [Kiritimatiellia bacterium]HPS06626.1 hypothetical protein [Kiritimatiellia bacterium]